jgi:sortase (surface protein transpeptidase)
VTGVQTVLFRSIIRAFGQKFTYAVRSVYHTDPKDTSAFGHKDQSWVTLVTCRQFDAKTNTYLLRTIVQAVLVQVENTANKDDR